jgi:hypothetical protein
MFAKDGSKATVLMLAMSSNPDAVAFNDVLNLQVEDQSGKATKKLNFTDAAGNNPLDLACAFSKIVPGTGSCFVVFHRSPGVVMDASAQRIQYQAQGVDAETLIKAFVWDGTTAQVFRSSDGQFLIQAERQGSGIKSLWLTYGE